MKYKITKGRIDDFIYKYINEKFPKEDMNVVFFDELPYGTVYLKKHGENPRIDIALTYYKPEYFEYSNPEMSEDAPYLIVQDSDFLNQMNELFGEIWHPIFEKWYGDNFKFPVNTFVYESEII